MSPQSLLFSVLAYFGLLYAVAWRTSRGARNADFFVGSRNSAWPLVAFGMIGTALSGLTFVSVPGSVGNDGFTYLQVVIGQLIGYGVVAFVLLPLYYRLGRVSIYAWLARRLGVWGWQTAAVFFIVSRTLGATARVYLVIRILQDISFDSLGVPFAASTAVIIGMIMLYTWRGGVKTIVWTDTLQTACMILGLVACIVFVLKALPMPNQEIFARIDDLGLTRIWGADILARDFWLKQVVAGAAIGLAMTGMDQEQMQKNISVRTLRGSQINMMVTGVAMLAVVFAFLLLGALMTLFAQANGLAARGDRLFPAVVMGYLPAGLQLVFVIALISALFPSADGALTALTSSGCNDVLRFEHRSDLNEAARTRLRKRIHLGFAVLFVVLTMVFRWIDDPSMIGLILKIAAYTYGPLFGLFAFGLFARRAVHGPLIAVAAVAAPLLCMLLDAAQGRIFTSYRIGLEMLLLNALVTYVLLWIAARVRPSAVQ
ncbi:MAG: sodium:solute symporter [Rhodospirillaceae bacterium]